MTARSIKTTMHKAAALAVVAAGAAIAASDVHASEVVPFDCGWRFKWEAGKGDVCEMAFDDSAWQVLDLPHDAQFDQPWTQKDAKVLRGYKPGARGFKPMGAMWYRKHFRAWTISMSKRSITSMVITAVKPMSIIPA